MIIFFKSKWLLAVLIPAVGWLGFSFIKINLHSDLVNKEVQGLEAKIANLEEENFNLEKILGYFNSQSFLEREARLRLNYKGADEEVAFVYPDEGVVAGSASMNTSEQLEKLPNPAKWVYYLLGY